MTVRRVIWILTTGCAVLAIGAIIWRNASTASPREKPGEAVAAMLSALEKDPVARRPETREIVGRVVRLHDSYTLHTAESWYAVALMKVCEDRRESALRAYDAAIALRPDWAWAHNGRAICLHALKRINEARDAFLMAHELAPQWSRPINGLAILYRQKGEKLRALGYAREAVSLEPSDLAANNNLGNILFSLGRLSEARKAYEMARVLDPSHPWPIYNLACLACREGKPTEALDLLKQAISANPVFRDTARDDPDLTSLRRLPAFRELVTQAGDGK